MKIIRQVKREDVKTLIRTGEYGYICEHGAVIENSELVIIDLSDFNNGNPCIIAGNAIKRDGFLVNIGEFETKG
jgi:hypothetical protein